MYDSRDEAGTSAAAVATTAVTFCEMPVLTEGANPAALAVATTCVTCAVPVIEGFSAAALAASAPG